MNKKEAKRRKKKCRSFAKKKHESTHPETLQLESSEWKTVRPIRTRKFNLQWQFFKRVGSRLKKKNFFPLIRNPGILKEKKSFPEFS